MRKMKSGSILEGYRKTTIRLPKEMVVDLRRKGFDEGGKSMRQVVEDILTQHLKKKGGQR